MMSIGIAIATGLGVLSAGVAFIVLRRKKVVANCGSNEVTVVVQTESSTSETKESSGGGGYYTESAGKAELNVGQPPVVVPAVVTDGPVFDEKIKRWRHNGKIVKKPEAAKLV